MKKSIIKQAKTKDEAIRLGLNEIGKTRDDVEIEIIEEGSAGFLGLGSKDAIVKIIYEEDMADSLFSFESEIKRDSVGGESFDSEYNVHDRSKYFTDQADANYHKDTEEEIDNKNLEKIKREGEAFDKSIDYIRDNPEDDLGEYGRFERINEYAENAKDYHSQSEDLSIEFEKRMDAIDDDGFKIERGEYIEEKPELTRTETDQENPDTDIDTQSEVIEDYQKEGRKDVIIDQTDNRDYEPLDAKVVERKYIEPNSSMTFGAVEEDEESIADDFTTKDVKVRNIAEQKQQADIDKYYQAKEFLEEILAAMHFENASVYGNLEGNTIKLDAKVEENDTGIAIGKGGITLDAIELIIRKSIDSRSNNLRVNVDINNYKKRRDEKIKELAADTARKVQRSRKSWNLKYMNSYERRLAHEEISKFPNVSSHSEGQEPKRYVVVSYVDEEEE